MLNEIEKGDIYFFYRKKMDVDAPKSIDDVQRMHMVLHPDNHKKKRLFVVGKKRMPEIHPGTSKSTEREWALNVMATTSGKKIRDELRPVEYETKTKGKRRQSASIPAAQGRYKIVEHDDHTDLTYRITQPENVGKAQKELGIRQEAGYIISVKNPKVKVPGFSTKQADYPSALQNKFVDKRWIDMQDSRLLDYENTQLLMIGARKSLSSIDVKITGKPKLFKNLEIDKKAWPTETLETGKFTSTQKTLKATTPRSSRTKGGRRGGKAALKSPSAAGIAQSLRGIDLPIDKSGVVDYARQHSDNEQIINVLEELPERKFNTMADVEKALREVR